MGTMQDAFIKAGLQTQGDKEKKMKKTDKRDYHNHSDSSHGQEKRSLAILAKPLPEDYVGAAQKAIENIQPNKEDKPKITTSKIRKILAFSSEIYNAEIRSREERLSSESAAKLLQMRVRILYEVGRDSNGEVQDFMKATNLLEYLQYVQDSGKRKDFICFARYLEALVAYHRYAGGKD